MSQIELVTSGDNRIPPTGDTSDIYAPSANDALIRQSEAGMAGISLDAVLVGSPEMPVPANPQVFDVHTQDGVRLRAAFWQRTSRRKAGTVCIFQGRSEFIEKYFEVISDLRRRGFAVIAFDWRGQGGSERLLANHDKGHIDDFDLYLRDIAAIFTQIVEPVAPKPWFGLAHSMGSAILMRALEQGEKRFERVVLASPMVQLVGAAGSGIAKSMAFLLDYLGLGGRFVPGGGGVSISAKPFEGNKLCNDPVRYARVARLLKIAPKLGLGDPTIGWAAAAFRAMNEFTGADFGHRFLTPSLLVAAGADPLCSTPAALQLTLRLRLCKGVEIIGAKHELMMETDPIRQQFWSAFDAFIPGSSDDVLDETSTNRESIAVQ